MKIANLRINKLRYAQAMTLRRLTSTRVHRRGLVKFAELEARQIKPRIGDFGHSELSPMHSLGFVTGFGRAGVAQIPACTVRTASGQRVDFATEDFVIRSPREWREDWLHLGYRYRSYYWQPLAPVKLIWGAAPPKSSEKKKKRKEKKSINRLR